LKNVSSLAAFFYVAAFRVLRELLSSFRSTNPTWLKQPSAAGRISVTETRLHKMLREQSNKMASDLASPASEAFKPRGITIEKAPSLSLPLSDGLQRLSSYFHFRGRLALDALDRKIAKGDLLKLTDCDIVKELKRPAT
jgi:hypothetical protein